MNAKVPSRAGLCEQPARGLVPGRVLGKGTCGTGWVDPGVESMDACYGDVSPTVEKSGYEPRKERLIEPA